MRMMNNMKKFPVLALGLFFTGSVFAQGGDEQNFQPATEADLQVQPMRMPALQEVGGSPFLTADYYKGNIEISDKRLVKDIPVKFNLFNNAIMIQKGGQDMKLELFETVTYTDGTNRTIILKQGYPEIDNHTDRSVYQVLSMGPKVHLLKFYSQKIEDAATLGDYSRREIVTTHQLYIYTPGGEIKKIKASKQSIADALPGLSSRIEELVSANKLNLKNEAAIAELVEALNKP